MCGVWEEGGEEEGWDGREGGGEGRGRGGGDEI